MQIFITGIAGFIGSSIASYFLKEGHNVSGVDMFLDNYPAEYKRQNLNALMDAGEERFHFYEENMLEADLVARLEGMDAVFHHAALPGVRESWGDNFSLYTNNNIMGTQRLLEACMQAKPGRIIYASSSSVYGNQGLTPLDESALPQPVSPYGVSKLAAEHLCHLYYKNFSVPVVSLRYFTVYGPRQRPEMAFHRFLQYIYTGQEITVYGDGNQSRDFTYIDDVVQANVAAMKKGALGQVYNVGGGHRMTINEVIKEMEAICGKKAIINYVEMAKGDVHHTWANCTQAKEILGFNPNTPIKEGLRAQAEWIRERYQISP